jgi:hypothetical protein
VVVVLGVGEDLLVGELAHHLGDRTLLVGHVLRVGIDCHAFVAPEGAFRLSGSGENTDAPVGSGRGDTVRGAGRTHS